MHPEGAISPWLFIAIAIHMFAVVSVIYLYRKDAKMRRSIHIALSGRVLGLVATKTDQPSEGNPLERSDANSNSSGGSKAGDPDKAPLWLATAKWKRKI